MKRHGKLLSLICIAVLAVSGSMLWVVQSGAVTHSTDSVASHGIQPNGNDFVAHTFTDENFCLSATPQPEGESPISISQCAVQSPQDWMFAQLPNGSVGIIDGLGLCLQNVGGKSLAVAVDPCTLSGKQAFLYSESGQITTANGKSCLEYAAAAQNASVSMQKCTTGLKTQVWQLSH
jgi:Ricin-type beta-trefoil lectin domain